MAQGDGDGDQSSEDGSESSRPSLSDLAERVKARQNRTSRDAPDTKVGNPSEETAPWHDLDLDDGFDPFSQNLKTEAIIEVIGGASSVLLVGPLLSPTDYDLCTSLTVGLPSDPDNLLLVTLTESPTERLNVFQGYLDQLPRELFILNVGDTTHTGVNESFSTAEQTTVTMESITDPTDLMRMGIAISKRLSQWDGSNEHTTVCFHSLTALLQYADDPQLVFRFVHILLGRLKTTGATAHFHIDANEPQVIATFQHLFDEILTFDDDGSVSVDH